MCVQAFVWTLLHVSLLRKPLTNRMELLSDASGGDCISDLKKKKSHTNEQGRIKVANPYKKRRRKKEEEEDKIMSGCENINHQNCWTQPMKCKANIISSYEHITDTLVSVCANRYINMLFTMTQF